MTAPEIVKRIVARHDAIATLTLVSYKPRRAFKEVEKELTQEQKLHRQFQNAPGARITVTRSDVLDGVVEKEIRALSEGNALSLSSAVGLHSGGTAHIPMIDIDFAGQTAIELDVITPQLKEVEAHGGVLLASGNGYHYFGWGLLSAGDWYRFLGRCLMVKNADARYVGHCLIDGETCLRISSRGGTDLPILAADIPGL
jgi:hypothetical protein